MWSLVSIASRGHNDPKAELSIQIEADTNPFSISPSLSTNFYGLMELQKFDGTGREMGMGGWWGEKD